MIYTYRCRDHGEFDIECPVGKAPERSACPRCRGASTRVYSVAVHFGPGFNPYGDRVQTSKEADERFGGGLRK